MVNKSMAEKKIRKGGRAPGVPNKHTAQVRQCLAELANNLAPKVEGWIEEVAEDDKYKAVQLYTRIIEYHIPKLSRQEVTGVDGEQLSIQVIRYGDNNNSK